MRLSPEAVATRSAHSKCVLQLEVNANIAAADAQIAPQGPVCMYDSYARGVLRAHEQATSFPPIISFNIDLISPVSGALGSSGCAARVYQEGLSNRRIKMLLGL